MTALRAFLLVATTSGLIGAGCAQGTMPFPAVGDDDPGTDPTDDGPDGGTPSDDDDDDRDPPADGPASPTGAKLILTEVVMTPSAGEYIEIANPSGSAVDLGTYYLSDSGHYYKTPAGAPAVENTDFVVKFPAGTSIPAHGVITVAIDTAANFTSTYGSAPTLALSQMTAVVINGTPSLTNAGELIVLFTWDGSSDLVRDVDMMLVGQPPGANGLLDKSGAMIDGPDADTTATAYKQDARTITVQPATPGQNKSTKRIAPEASFQMQTGTGNGMLGDDETSENTAMTWDTAFTAPTPGIVPAGLN